MAIPASCGAWRSVADAKWVNPHKPQGDRVMLILTRKVGERIVIGEDTFAAVLGTKGFQIRMGIDAPKEVLVLREEVHGRVCEESRQSDDS
jgi:carbon storage regulator